MKKEKQQAPDNAEQTTPQPEHKLEFKHGGIYFHAGVIIGRKNVFVSNEHLDSLATALKMAELKHDIKNLAYVVMPNFFYWMFQLSPRLDNPLPIIGDVKKRAAVEILNNLRRESKEKPYETIGLFKGNARVSRTTPDKILWTFEEQAKKFEGNKRYKVWAPRTGVQLVDTDETLQQKLAIIKHAPVSDRWQIVARAENYPYLYVNEELESPSTEDSAMPSVVQAVRQAMAMPIA